MPIYCVIFPLLRGSRYLSQKRAAPCLRTLTTEEASITFLVYSGGEIGRWSPGAMRLRFVCLHVFWKPETLRLDLFCFILSYQDLS